MLRFNIFYYLFAALAVLALVANARPTSSQPDTGSVAGMPGMAATMNHPDGQSTQHKETSVDMESNYMNEMEMALEAAQKAAAQKATATTAGPARPTPGVPTTTPSATDAKAAQPSASAPAAAAAKPKGMLSSLPLVGGLADGLPLPV